MSDKYLCLMSNTSSVQAYGETITSGGVKPELEVFDTGHLWLAIRLIDEGLIADPPWIQLCTGIPYGMPTDATAALGGLEQ